MKRLLLTVTAALCITEGSVLARFSNGVIPTEFLGRPLIIAAAVAIVIGLLSMTAGRYAPLMAAAGSLAVITANWWTLVGYVVVVAAAAFTEHKGWTVDPVMPTMTAAGVFAVIGLVGGVPHLSMTEADIPEEVDSSPVYLILLDAYSRPDVLGEMGVDVSSFVQTMETRGFEHYPDARSTSYHTHWVLARMLTGKEGSGWGTTKERRELRDTLELPKDFVMVAPGVGHVTIKDAVDIGPGGVNDFEIGLVRRSAFVHFPWVGEMMLDLWRKRIAESLKVVATTEHSRVFAHIMAPHVPYLYGPDGDPLGIPACWAECNPFTVYPLNQFGLEATLQWLNTRLIETVDQILTARPDAIIVLFGDHGLRVSGGIGEDAYKPLLLARTPGSPGLFADTPRPDVVFDRVLETQSTTSSTPKLEGR